MKRLVDVVNFNADASCLPSAKWLEALSGGTESVFCRWLRLYVDRGKKIVLGLTGASVADIATWNHEAIDLINRNPGIFEIILRPFAHDISLLRSGEGFSVNFDYGKRIIGKEFRNVAPFFLPPEFMLTGSQLELLSCAGVIGVFINPGRFSAEVQRRIPPRPYRVAGVSGSSLGCIPICGALTGRYLDSLHRFGGDAWNEGVSSAGDDPLFSWRDGESPFLFPRGLEREQAWLDGEAPATERLHLAEVPLRYLPGESLEDHHFRGYPIHSFSAWMKEFRMLGFIHRLQDIEAGLDRLERPQVHLWLLAINSDILSSIEKKSPVISMRESPTEEKTSSHTILRSDRWFEGEECLCALEYLIRERRTPDFLSSSRAPHILRVNARIRCLEQLDAATGHGGR